MREDRLPIESIDSEVSVAADSRDASGECPLWHPEEAALYWADIPAGRMYRLDPATGYHQCVYIGRPVGGMTLRIDGGLVLFRDKGNVVIEDLMS